MARKKFLRNKLNLEIERFATEFSPDFTTQFYKPKGRIRPRESNKNPTGHRKDVKVGIREKLS